MSPDVSVILVEPPEPAPILISCDSIPKIEDSLLKQCGHSQPGSNSSIAGLEETFLKQCALGHETGSHARSCNKCVRIQVPGEDVEELVFEGNNVGNTSNDGRGVDSARVYESQSASTLQRRCPLKVKSEHKHETPKEHESIGRSSEVDSPSSSCASARAQYYHNKLLATLQILRNKEETVRVQTESLAVAEARIASLTARSNELKREIERKGCELKTLRETIQKSRIEKSDVSITAQIQEIDNQKSIVTTLQSNLGVIEDLYRECFYETAKQEGLIEMLRKSYLDVRLMDKEKSDQISRLHNVINTQKWSLDKCQDIASDVDNLKAEISNFLNSSNNDSGVWEDSLAGDLSYDLHDIAGQLLSLKDLLTGDCTCGLEEENRRLRQNNEVMERQIDDLRQKLADLEIILENKNAAEMQHQEQIRVKESELHLIRQQLAAVECDTRERGHTCESVKMQLHQTQVLLKEKSAEVSRVQTQCRHHEETIRQLTDELEQTKDLSKEYCALRECSCAAQRRVRTLRAELAKALHDYAHLEACHRSEVKDLERALCEAQARGAALCEEARRAAARVRAYTLRTKDSRRQQETQIKQQKSQIRLLELRLEQGQNDATLTRRSENETCTKCTSARSIGSFERSNIRSQSSFERRNTREEATCSKCSQNEGSFTSGSSRVREGRQYALETSASETGRSSPAPPQRPARMKRSFCENRMLSPARRDASVQRPHRCDAATMHLHTTPTHTHTHCAHLQPSQREVVSGSVEDVLSRVESAGAALADSLRRWNKHGTLHRT